MSRRFSPVLVSALAALILAASAVPGAGQLKIGQYEDEAPLRTWNSFGAATAISLARGGASLAWAEDGLSAWSNPALLAGLPPMTIALSGSIQIAQCNRFSLVNTGVVGSAEPLAARAAALEGAALTLRWKGWTAAIAAGVWEAYDRPAVLIEESSGGSKSYGLAFAQSGQLRAATIGLARRFGRLSLGVSLHALWGGLTRTLDESWSLPSQRFDDRREMTFAGIVPQGGLAWDLAPKWTLGASVRAPWTKSSTSRSRLEFTASEGPTDIVLESAEEDALGQPWIAGLGTAFRPTPDLTIAADAVWFGWSGYAPRVFGEIRDRGFRDVVRLAAGAEYRSSLALFGRKLGYPLRVGLVYDPQPMRDPESAYLDFTFGTGLEWKSVRLDLGVLIGKENGSGDGLTVRKVSLGLAARL
jgi:hypothetical protein